jgi:signal transduction histidine kinase
MMKQRHTVLVVDDEPDVVRSVKDLLRLEFRVLGATTADEAMRMMEEDEIHVIMSDQRMPNMTGVELLGRVRGKHPDAIRLLFTGYSDLKAVIEAINTGHVYRYIAKPWDPDELLVIIREAARQYELLVERKELTEQLEVKNKELEAANVQLRQINDLKTTFIQVASHELRTPLTILLGLVSLANRLPCDNPTLADLLRRIDSATQRIQRLMQHILTMLASQKFDQSLDREPVSVAELVQSTADDVRPFITLRHQALEVEIDPNVGTAHLDRLKLRDALNHLLLNAIKFTHDEGRITLRAGRENGTLVLSVSDTGVGMDERHLSRLFEPFFTGFDASRHSSGHYEFGRQGLGLGLSVVKAFVEMHGGTVQVQSEVDKGSTFTIRIPYSTEPARPG